MEEVMNPEERIEGVRRFNRFYTRQIGVLQEGLLDSSFSLTEARVLYEIAHGTATATELIDALSLDPGYLARILKSFEKQGLIQRKPSKEDERRKPMQLGSEGKRVFAKLDVASKKQVREMLAKIA